MQVPRLEQMRPSAQRALPHIGPVGAGPPVHWPSSEHCVPDGQIRPFVHSV